jgi:hypothetical protein
MSNVEPYLVKDMWPKPLIEGVFAENLAMVVKCQSNLEIDGRINRYSSVLRI